MKKFVLSTFCLLFCALLSHATIHVVMVSNYQFSPSSMNVFVGDTVRYQWVNGSHTTTCDPVNEPGTSLPAGAATWDMNMRSSSPLFDYKVTVAGTYNYYCIPHSPNMAGSFVAQANLPLKLSAFNLEAASNNALLTWKTATEQNTERFSVRRSIDGSNFTEIASIPAAGNSTSEKIYSFSDNKSNVQKFYYYNIALIDRDGRQVITDTKLFKNTKATNSLVLTLSPNPISNPGHLNMTFNSEKEGKMAIQVINAEGKTIINRNMQAYVGINKGHIHLGEQPAGTYTLVCTMDGVTESHQVVYSK